MKWFPIFLIKYSLYGKVCFTPFCKLLFFPLYPAIPWLKVKSRVNVVQQPTACRDFTCMYQPAHWYSACVQKPQVLSPLLAFPSSFSPPMALHLKPPSVCPESDFESIQSPSCVTSINLIQKSSICILLTHNANFFTHNISNTHDLSLIQVDQCILLENTGYTNI